MLLLVVSRWKFLFASLISLADHVMPNSDQVQVWILRLCVVVDQESHKYDSVTQSHGDNAQVVELTYQPVALSSDSAPYMVPVQCPRGRPYSANTHYRMHSIL